MWSAIALVVLLQPGAGLVDGVVRTADGREIPALIHVGDLEDGHASARISPKLAAGAFWSFGDTFQRAIFYGCASGAPTLTSGVLSCPAGDVVLRPDVTLPDDPTAHPNSNVPPVVPGGRPVVQSLHVFAPWLLPVAVGMALLGLVAFLAGRKLPETTARDPAPALTRRALAACLALTGIGAALRLIGLGWEPFEQNEFTYYMSGFGHASPLAVVLDVNGMAQTHPPLFHLVLWAFSGLGSDEVVARLPAALAGVAAIPMVFVLAWRLTDGNLVAAGFAAAFCALSPVHAWYSQDVSPYTFVVAFAALVLLSADTLLRDPTGRRAWWGAIAGTWGLFYTHYYGLHLSLCVFVLLLLRAPRRTIRAGAITGLGLLPWLPAFATAYQWSKAHSTAYQRLEGVYHPTADHLHDLLDLLRLVAGYPTFAALLSVAGVALLALLLPRLRLKNAALLWAPVVWFVPFELLNRFTFLHGLYDGWYFGVRYFLFLFPIAWVVAGACVVAIAPRPQKVAVTALAVISLTLAGFESIDTLRRADKPDVATAARIVKNHLADGDAVIVGPAVFYQHPFHYYYAEHDARDALTVNDMMQTPRWQLLPGAERGGPSWVGVLSALFEPYAQTLRSRHIRRVWVVDHTQHLLGRREFSDRPSERILAAVGGLDLVWTRSLHDVTVSLYQRLEWPPGDPPARVHFGWSDGPWVRRLSPPWAYAGPGRRVQPGSQVVLPVEKRPRRLHLRAGTTPPGGHQHVDPEAPTGATLRVRIDGRPAATLQLSQTFDTHAIDVPLEAGATALILDFDLDRPDKGLRPPDVVLDVLRAEY